MKAHYVLAFILLLSTSVLSQYGRSVRNLEVAAEAKAGRGDPDGAINDFSRAIEIITRLQRSGNGFANDRSAEYPSEVRAVDTRAAGSLIGRAKAYIAKRRIPEAWRDVENAIRLVPSEPSPYFI